MLGQHIPVLVHPCTQKSSQSSRLPVHVTASIPMYRSPAYSYARLHAWSGVRHARLPTNQPSPKLRRPRRQAPSRAARGNVWRARTTRPSKQASALRPIGRVKRSWFAADDTRSDGNVRVTGANRARAATARWVESSMRLFCAFVQCFLLGGGRLMLKIRENACKMTRAGVYVRQRLQYECGTNCHLALAAGDVLVFFFL